MPSAISRQTSTVSLLSQSSVHAEANFLVQSLSRHRRALELGCDRILKFRCPSANKESSERSQQDLPYVSDNQISLPFPYDAPSSNTSSPPRLLEPRAREALGQHLIRILATIVLPDPPQSIDEVDARLVDGLPSIPEKMMPSKSDSTKLRKLAMKRPKGVLNLPIKEVHMAFKEFNDRFNFTVTWYILAVTEHIIANFLQAVICYEEKALTENIIRVSTIDTMFKLYQERIRTKRKTTESKLATRFPQDYDKCVDELNEFLRTTLEQLNLLLRIFREPVLKCQWDSGSNEDYARTVLGSLLELYSNIRICADTLNAEEDADFYHPQMRSYDVQYDDPCSDSPVSLRGRTTLTREATTTPTEADRLNTIGQRHLVGISLIELAEEDSLHTFSHYASCVLESLSRGCTWAMIESPSLIQILCRLSRSIVRTASLSRPAVFSFAPNHPNLWADIHSSMCERCQFWDSPPAPRRRSTSSSMTCGQSPERQAAPALDLQHSKTLPKHQRTSNSSSTLEEPIGTANCNYLVNCFKYLLPRLLLIPIFHFFYLHELIKTLHQCAYDEDDRARLKEVLSMLSKTRSAIEREFTRHPWLFVHLSRLLSTGQLLGQYRLLYLDLLSASPAPPSPTAYASVSSPGPSPKANGSSSAANSPGIPDSQKGTSFGFPPSVLETPPSSFPCPKLDEIERLLGSKGKLAAAIADVPNVGDFVMESRIHLSTENKKSLAEHVAYLFSGVLLICKWQERRSALSPTSGANMVLRLKYHISLESIHLIDLPPIIQPNITTYIGNSGSIASSAVGAAVQAVTSASPHGDDSGSMVSSLVGGSAASQSTLTISTGSAHPYMFELEYLDPINSSPVPGQSASIHRMSCPHRARPLSPQKLAIRNSESNQASMADGHFCSSPEASEPNSTCHCISEGIHRITIAVRSVEEKADWMASLLSIQVQRLFLRYIRTLPKIEVPLRLPSPTVYRFSQPDSPDTIVYETKNGRSFGSLNNLAGVVNSSDEDFSGDDASSSDLEDFINDKSTLLISGPESVEPCDKPANTLGCVGNEDSSDRDTLTMHTVVPLLSAFRKVHSDSVPSGATALSPSRPTGVPTVIRSATIEKLIERLTYPAHFDTRLVNMFLLMYRRVLNAEMLLNLLIERFRIPDPEFLPEEFVVDADRGQLESPAQHMLKRFRSGYKKRIQTRVIMVISRWVRTNRYYQVDFAPNPKLRHSIADFLLSVQARHLVKPIRRILQHIQPEDHLVMDPIVPAVMENCKPDGPQLDITAIHPCKLAEQVTLYEWELYRSIQFWEVEGRNRSECPTPNLDRSKQFSNRFRNWLVYLILSEPHPADRVIVIERVIDLMLIMERMNNLQGCQEAKSALISAAVYRLRKSFNVIRRFRHYRDIVDKLRKENTVGVKTRHKSSSKASQSSQTLAVPASGSRSKSFDRVSSTTETFRYNSTGFPLAFGFNKSHDRRIKALAKQHEAGLSCRPCVPFIAAGVLTRVIHLDLRYPDTTRTENGTELINCSKFYQMADIIERYLAFQRIPYAVTVDPEIRPRLESLDPFALAGVTTESEFERRMYELSEKYEPRGADANSDNVSSTTVERRLSKEAIQAASLLSNVSLKERISFQTVFSFTNLLAVPPATTTTTISGFSSRIFTPVQSAISHAMCKSFHSLSPSTHSRPSTDLQSASSPPHPARSGLPSPLVSQTPEETACFHQHSASDSRVVSSSRNAANVQTSVHLQNPHQTVHSFVEFTPSHTHSHSHPPLPPSSSSHCTVHPHHHSLPPPLPPRMSVSSGRLSQSPHSFIHCPSSSFPSSRSLFSPDQLDSDPLPPPLPPKRLSQTPVDKKSSVSDAHDQPLSDVFAMSGDPASHGINETPPPVPPRRLPKSASEFIPIQDTVKSPVPPI